LSSKTQHVFEITDNGDMYRLFGPYDENLALLEDFLNVKIAARGKNLVISGQESEVELAKVVVGHLINRAMSGKPITAHDIRYATRMMKEENKIEELGGSILTNARGRRIGPRTSGQKKYIEAIQNNSLVFGIGPAGTGKTYIAVAMAVSAFKKKEVDRIILTRPAVEAGERLGFLPGDIQEKVNPYLRPLYDALFDVLGIDTFHKYMERGLIEVAPLAYMRGRTLESAFVILDEAQNTTQEQMKMFLTRLGLNSKAVITGDITQIDLPKGTYSGLDQVRVVLRDVPGIEFVYLSDKDVVRHELVSRIIRAYERFEQMGSSEERH
jgi:phosphate starvation-inducible PhoH-like protein